MVKRLYSFTALFGLASLLMVACAPLTSSVNGTPGAPGPTPIISTIPAATQLPQPTPAADSTPAATPDIIREVQVDHVEVEIGVGSPIPVHVLVSGNLPNTCAQLEQIQQSFTGSEFQITITALNAAEANCIPDTLPFTARIPLNVVNLPAGAYTAVVNGVSAPFNMETGHTSSLPAAADVTKNDIQVDAVNVDIGIGSPIPVHVVVSGNLPDTCAQLGEVRLHREGTEFYVRLIAHSRADVGCMPDSLPFRLELPLSLVNLPAGPYDVNVNGATASFDPRAIPAGVSEPTACTDPVDVSPQDGVVTYRGISFRLDPALAYGLAVQDCPAVPYREGQAPGEAHPAYTTFVFPSLARQDFYLLPEVRVYAVTGDMQDYLYPLNSVSDLRAAIDQRPEPVTWFDAASLHTRQTYLGFADGAGVRGLVQYMQDRFFFTNNGLLYEFNGLTQDGRHFVSVRHPLTVPFLMELAGPDPHTNLNAGAIAIPAWPDDYAQQLPIIQAYNEEALRRLEAMPEGSAAPNIALLDALVQSIQVTEP